MNAAILNERDQVVFSADLDGSTQIVEVAGAVARDGGPVNRKAYRVSRSKRNLRKAEQDGCVPSIVRREHQGQDFWIVFDETEDQHDG